jgi:polyisoprenoid-binding protein YceI
MLARPTAGRRRPLRGLGVALAAGLLLAAAPARAGTYHVDPGRSTLLLRTYRAGPAGRLAHDHAVQATEFTGTIDYDPARPEACAVSVEVRTDGLRVDEPAARRRLGLDGDLGPDQRRDVERAMRGPDQLDVARFPTIRFASTAIRRETDGGYRVTGQLTIHGVTREVTFPAEVALDHDVLRAHATFGFLQSSFGYRPYRAFLGAVQNRDEVTLHVELAATP